MIYIQFMDLFPSFAVGMCTKGAIKNDFIAFSNRFEERGEERGYKNFYNLY